MRKITSCFFILFIVINLGYAQKENSIVETSYIERILNHLASDDMRGRHAFTKDAVRAAEFIADEFKAIGLDSYGNSYLQTFTMKKVNREENKVILNKEKLDNNSFLILGNEPILNWNENSNIKIVSISKSDDFATLFRKYANTNENLIILIDPSYKSFITRFNKIYGKESIINDQSKNNTSKAFIVTNKLPESYNIKYKNNIQLIPMSNVIGVIPGKSEPNEYVIFSGHYDHIGILPAVDQDSIANGADDDASGITAMISLAKYYKEQNNNARTLIFVAFTAEEIGMYGSTFFSNNINADQVTAMINIEMIGKDSKFGPNSLYITGYDKSNLGELMQKNLEGSSFTFHPDPYANQNLFYRSDNAVLAALGVPAHTFSTSQIDKDEYYHSVKDEVSTLNLENIKASIEAIAIGAKGLVDGSQTPTRVEKLKN